MGQIADVSASGGPLTSRMNSLHGKLALITGAASGIGRALAIELARAGVELLLVDVDRAGLLETVERTTPHGRHADWHVADLGSSEAISGLIQRVYAEFSALDILVNNAGVAYYGTSHEMSTEQWNRVLTVNLHAPIQLSLALLPLLSQRPEAHILNVCSIAGLVGVNRLAAYNAAKFGLVGYSESLRAEYGPRGIGVTALCPGLVRTRIFENAMTSRERNLPRFPRWLTSSPEFVARRAVRAIRKNQGQVVISVPARIVWWIKRLAPNLLDRLQRVRRIRRPIAERITPVPQVNADSFRRAG
jgi:3-oxoacyl-[acyl-carrier protein] reductase